MITTRPKSKECLLCKYYLMWFQEEAKGMGEFVTNARGETLGKCKIFKKNVHPNYHCGRFKSVREK